MDAAQIKHMVNRFLGWRLPEDFSPDAGISFKPTFNDHLPQPTRHEPTGTNLFCATQAEEMVRYMIDGLPEATLTEETARLKERVRVLEERLKPFAEVAEHIALSPGFAKHYMPINLGLMNGNVVQSLIEWKLTVEDFRRARSALHTTPEVGE